MSGLAVLIDRLDAAVREAVRTGRIGVPRSLRLHVGGASDGLPPYERLLALGDAIFQCPRAREAQTAGAALCVWEQGQVATVSSAPAVRQLVVLAVLGSEGAIHLTEQSP